MVKKPSRIQKWRAEAEALLDERIVWRGGSLTRLQKFVHFWVLVARSFTRNRCPVRASALAYATLLALIPMLAVIVSVTSTFLKKEGEDRIDQFIMHAVSSVTPPAMLATNTVAAQTNVTVTIIRTNTTPAVTPEETGTNVVNLVNQSSATNQALLPSFIQGKEAMDARRRVARSIHDFIQNTRSGAMGVTGTIVLIFVAISMLARIEDTFNDIWGVSQGRTWFTRIVLYWGVISLAPLLMVLAVALLTGPHLEGTKEFLSAMPLLSKLIFRFLPLIVLCLTFSLFYMAVPNVKVRWEAAVVGGLVAGLLLFVNNMISVLYVSRVVSNSMIYGSLGLVPVFMIGLYFAWLILLFGAQVAYAFQNRATYFEEKQAENINQRGREFIAMRLMTVVGQHFVHGKPAPTLNHLSQSLGVPSRLVQQLMQTLCAAHLVVETAGLEPAYLPARPMESITCHDLLQAMRATQGQELATRDEPTRAEVYGEFQRIQEAERQAASSVNMLALVHRAESQEKRGALTEVVESAPTVKS